MRALMDRISYWWEERTAVLEDETMDRVVPPSDHVFDRLEAWYVSGHARVLAFDCDPTSFYSAYGVASGALAPWFYLAALTGIIIAALGIAGGILGTVGIITQSARRIAPRYPK